MRMMIKVEIPTAAGNKGVQDGGLPKTIMSFVEQFKPEGSYFVTENGNRCGYFFVDVKDNASIPQMCEPFFMNLDAKVTAMPAMVPADLKTGLERAAANR